MLTFAAPAKINLSLEILCKRTDGFHEVVSVMQEVSLCDELAVAPFGHLRFRVDADCGPASENLVLRAARTLKQRTAPDRGADISLHKRIPVGAGLGGGSSDAATTLVALNAAWQSGRGCETLLPIAAALGSDVPFFLTGGTALVTGRGERVTPLPTLRTSWYLLTNPGLHVSTAEVFGALDPSQWSSGSRTREVARCIREGTEIPLGVNGLAQTLFRLYPEAEACFRAADNVAPGQTWVSGSGPTIASRFESRSDAERASMQMSVLGYATFVVRNYPTEERELPCRED